MSGFDDDDGHGGGGGGGHDAGGGLRWLLTYADLITLLLIFFVIMYSIADTISIKLEIFSQSVSKGFHVDKRAIEPTSNAAKSLKEMSNVEPKGDTSEKEKDKDKTHHFLYKKLKGLSNYGLSVVSREKGTSIRIEATNFFDTGGADLTKEAKAILRYTAMNIKKLSNDIAVEGYSDTTPPGKAYASNWELSTIRALNVLKYLESEGVPADRLSVVGYGSNHPVAPNDIETGNALNRRVEVVVLNEKEH